MSAKPFLLDPAYETLLDSSAFRHRFAELRLGRSAEPWLLFPFAQFPTVICVILGFALDARVFLGAAIYGGAVCLMFAIAAMAIRFEGPTRQRIRHLAFEGDLVTGRIVHCVRKRAGPDQPDAAGSYCVEVKYAVTAPSGKEITGVEMTMREDLMLHDPLPSPGTPVLVLIIDETLHAIL